jgi:hypothetical protein
MDAVRPAGALREEGRNSRTSGLAEHREGAALAWRAARKPRRARRRRGAGAAHDVVSRRGAEQPIQFTVPWFRLVYLQNFELKCTMWSIGKL